MTVKQEAEELVEVFQFNGDMNDDIRMSFEDAKDCALICVYNRIVFIKELQVSDLMKGDLVENQLILQEEILKL